MENTSKYQSPFNTRYAGDEMSYLFSQDKRFRTWRKLWISLAKAEKELGLLISPAQIEEMEKYENDINYEDAIRREKEVRHDVMSHVYAFGLQAKSARPIIHLGATSCYVTDNGDIIIMREALMLTAKKIAAVISNLKEFALKYKDMPTLGFTHFQPAQLTTVGKRAALWIQDLMTDLEEIERIAADMPLLGSKGATGTQASFMELFDNDEEKVKAIDGLIAKDLGFNRVFPVTGQTYPRKLDSIVLNALSLLAQSAAKFAGDMRLLQHLKEIEEPFEKSQIGSSAMAYKRNPMRAERISGLSRFLISLSQNPAQTASTQWLERTLDDSANRRLSVSEAFLTADSILNIYLNMTDGLVVYPEIIKKRIAEELPFMATENILMQAVKNGGDRQELHEIIRGYSMEAGRKVKMEGKENELMEMLVKDPVFGLSKDQLETVLNPELYTGRAASQTEEYIKEFVEPALAKYSNLALKKDNLLV